MIKEKHGIYVHIPFCKARCGYCAFSSCTDYALAPTYFQKLFEEIDYYADSSVAISTIYVGGGTPSSVDKELINRLFGKLRAKFDLSQVEEVTVECNPESVTEELLRCLKANGVNRLSFGLQSVNDFTLKRIGRLHDFAQFQRALKLAHQCGFDNVSADLILGLPESKNDLLNSVKTVSNLDLKHVSIYALELHENTTLFKQNNGQEFFGEDELADMYDEACSVLVNRGFFRYEISNFSHLGWESKHNLNYWTEGRYFAFGAAASGFVGDVRYVNPFEIERYISTPVRMLHGDCETLSNDEQANEFVMLGLRLIKGISLTEFRTRFGKDFFAFFPNATHLEKLHFLRVENGRVMVPEDKLYVVNSILVELLTI